MPFGGPFLSYEEIFGRRGTAEEIKQLLTDLNAAETMALLCQVNADLRLVKREKEDYGALQSELAGGMLDDHTIARLKQRFPTVHCGDRPLFHTTQILNVMRLVANHSNGTEMPSQDSAARYKLGSACLMMNDLFLTDEEKVAISSGDDDSRRQALMAQMLGPFEIVNTQANTHLLYRSRAMFRVLLRDERVLFRIRKNCGGFDFEREFLAATSIPLTTWLFLIFLVYAYLMQYRDEHGSRNHQFLGIDPRIFRGQSRISAAEFESFLGTTSLSFDSFKRLLDAKRPVDWRFDFTPFKGKPLIELHPNKYFCTDVGFLMEKMHGGVYWTLFDALKDRKNLFQAWGILFEEYVNWFLSGRKFCTPVMFYPSPAWSGGTECFDGAFVQDCRFVPMEYKGKVLKLEARYSADVLALESDMDLKIVEGCQQLAWKIERLFNINHSNRRKLKDIPLESITRVVPVLVVQDHILRSPLVNWRLNHRFNAILDRGRIHPDVTIDPLNVVGIQELETMAESAEGGKFDILQGLQLRCFRDPEMKSQVSEFLSLIPEYGEGKSQRIETLMKEQFEELAEYSFGQTSIGSGAS